MRHSSPGGPGFWEGFWGETTASVDWCEANYAHSRYVCELFNTLSSLVIVAVGLLGLWMHRHVLERRFLAVFGSVALVGVGSTAFHGTLLFELQMLDELPMLYTATLLVYLLLENRRQRRYGHWLPLALIGYVALATYGAAFTRGTQQFWLFQTTFAALELFAMFRTFLLYRTSQDAAQRRLFRNGISLYLVAIVSWYLDLGYCDELVAMFSAVGLPNLQLHAVWHVLVALGLYALILVIAVDRMRVLEQSPLVERAFVLVWLTSATPQAAATR
jgi:dihydroceramidase